MMSFERLPVTRTFVPVAACVALLGMGVRGDHAVTVAAGCEFTTSAFADASQLPAELHEGLKQAVDIYNMVDAGPLTPQETGDYHKSLRLSLPDSATQIKLDITATDKFPTLDGGNPFPDNVTNLTTQIIDGETGIPYARQTAEKYGTAWKLTADYLTKESRFGDSYQTTSVATTGGIFACATQTEYAVQNKGRHTVMTSVQAEMYESVDVAHQASRVIVGQLVVMAGAQQYVNPGIMNYQFPTQDRPFLTNFGIVAPVRILQPPESKL